MAVAKCTLKYAIIADLNIPDIICKHSMPASIAILLLPEATQNGSLVACPDCEPVCTLVDRIRYPIQSMDRP